MTAADIKLNPAEQLPPVRCPLLIEVDGELVRASRTGYIESKDRAMEYKTADGVVIHGRYRWTYP